MCEIETKTKICSGCGVEKAANASEFHRRAGSPDGLCGACRKCRNAATARWKKANPEKVASWRRNRTQSGAERSKDLRLLYGMTAAQYWAIIESQGGTCAMCPAVESECGRRLCVDHCHKTGEIRGILCGSCNKLLGFARDSVERLEAGKNYLLRFESRRPTDR